MLSKKQTDVLADIAKGTLYFQSPYHKLKEFSKDDFGDNGKFVHGALLKPLWENGFVYRVQYGDLPVFKFHIHPTGIKELKKHEQKRNS